jgi:hypothetical protein
MYIVRRLATVLAVLAVLMLALVATPSVSTPNVNLAGPGGCCPISGHP